MDEGKIIKYIMLSQIKGIGPVTQNAILDQFHNIDEVFAVDKEELLSSALAGVIGKDKLQSFIMQRNKKELSERAEGIWREAGKGSIDVITRDDRHFPARFGGIPDMPILLYAKGNLKINEYPASVGIVGARRCSAEGKEKTIELTREAISSRTAVISGMAKGIDSYAHTAAIKMQGYTIAVLGNGADICYPKEHAQLYEAIAANGCILSEYPPGTPPRAFLFPMRNRLIAALSDKLYVIEAGRNSGTESTVENSIRYGRKVVRLAVWFE